jgi:hypothetical protein
MLSWALINILAKEEPEHHVITREEINPGHSICDYVNRCWEKSSTTYISLYPWLKREVPNVVPIAVTIRGSPNTRKYGMGFK